MDYRQAGATDVHLSVVGLGGAWLGHDLDDTTHVSRATDVLRAADETGVNWVDTSENYFDTGNEAVIGVALRQLNDSFMVCSKVAPGALRSGGGSGFRPEQVRRACQDSLHRLGPQAPRYVPTALARRVRRAAVGHLGRDGFARRRRTRTHDRTVELRSRGHRPVSRAASGRRGPDGSQRPRLPRRPEHDRVVRRAADRRGDQPLASGILSDTPIAQVRQRWMGTPWEDSEFFQTLLSVENEDRTSGWSTVSAPSVKRSVRPLRRSRSRGCSDSPV